MDIESNIIYERLTTKPSMFFKFQKSYYFINRLL